MVFISFSSADMVWAGYGRYCYGALSKSSRNGDPMDVAGLSHERGARPVAARPLISSRDRRTHRAHPSVVRPEPATDRPAGDADPAAPDAADHRQADYFMRLLAQSRRLVDQRIDEYHQAIAAAQINGDVEAAGSLRRMARIEEQDRQTLDGMLEKLQRRFPRRSPGLPARSPRTRPPVR